MPSLSSWPLRELAHTNPGSQRTPRRTSQPVETGNDLTEITVEAQAREITSISETQQILVTSPPHSSASDSPAAHVIGEEDIETPISPLPPFSSSSEPTFSWGDMDGETFSCALNGIHDETVHWKRNLFNVPSGKVGTAFVRELSKMFRVYTDRSALESVAMKAAMVMPALLLQKPHPRSKAKDHVMYLERRLQLWGSGKLKELLDEGHTIQHQLSRKPPKQQEDTARIFTKLMMEGKVRAALQIVTDSNGSGILPLDKVIDVENNNVETVRGVLLKKHPHKQPPRPSSLIKPDSPPPEPHPVMFEVIDGKLIRSMMLKMDGAAGPSGLDATAWKRMCTSFKTESADLCESLANTARRLCSEYVDLSAISALVACRLIALDKCPGVRPIGVGETV